MMAFLGRKKWLCALVLFAVCVGIMMALGSCATKRVLYPGYYSGLPSGASPVLKKYEVVFERDGVELVGWYVPGAGKRLVVYYGGNAEELSHSIDRIRRFGCSVLLVNYRGYGKSGGEPSEKALVGDAVYILDAMVAKTNRKYSDVVLVGQSLGSGVASQVAARRDVGKLVLIVPFDSIDAVANGLLPVVPLSWFISDHYRSDKAARNIKAPVSIVAAGNDEVIPVKHARRLAEIFRENRTNSDAPVVYREFKGAGHNDLWLYPQVELYLRKEVNP